jgi:hypothetical protein
METISISINLAATKHAIKSMKNKAGEQIECIVIPVVDNHLFKSDKGGVYLNLIGFPMKEPKNNQTHIIKQSFKKEIIDALTEDQKKQLPIFGNLSAFNSTQTGEVVEITSDESDDDLPF